MQWLRKGGQSGVVVMLSTLSSLVVSVPSSSNQLILSTCSSTDATQNWQLVKGGWGSNYTIQNIGWNGDALTWCFDVSGWLTKHAGQSVNAHECCQTTAQCAHPSKNYNEQWSFDDTTDTVHVFDPDRTPGLCLTADGGSPKAGAALVLGKCATATKFVASADGSAPLLRLASNLKMCVGISTGPPVPPAPTSRTPACVLANTTALPFCDTTLSTAARAKDLVQRMTAAEKLVQLIGGIGGGVTPATPRLGVPAYQYHSEGLHGLRTTCKLGPGHSPLYSTMFPQVTGMAATGNLSLIHAMAAHMGDEARAVNNYMVQAKAGFPGKGGGLNYWGPTLNIGRDPRWGRLQESVSEDPWLNGAYSSNFVAGIQGAGDGVKFTKIAACCKHFYAYSLEDADGFTRHNFNAAVTARDLAETYLPPFAACVAAAPEQVMCSYNAVNGVPTCLDDQAQNGWLRKTQKYAGLVVSDCDAVGDAFSAHHYSQNVSQAAAQGIRAGCDLDCGSTYKSKNLQDALDAGLMTMADIDLAVERTFAMRFNLGMFDPVATNDYSKIGRDVLNSAHGKALAVAAARESIILLQNDGGALPLTLPSGGTIVVIGSIADSTAVLAGGKSDYCPEQPVSLLAGLQAAANASSGAWKVTYLPTATSSSDIAVARAAAHVVVVRGGVQDGEAHDRKVLFYVHVDCTYIFTFTFLLPSLLIR